MTDRDVPLPDDEPSPDELVVMLSRFRDHDFARMVVLFVTIAAQQYPEEIRKALAVVFSTETIEDGLKRLLVTFAELQGSASDLRHRAEDDGKRLDELEGRIGAVADDYLILRKRCAAALAWLKRQAAAIVAAGKPKAQNGAATQQGKK